MQLSMRQSFAGHCCEPIAQGSHKGICQMYAAGLLSAPSMACQTWMACLQVRVWVPAAVMRRAQAMMVQGTGPGSSGLTLTLRSSFHESSVPLQVSIHSPCALVCCLVCSALPGNPSD